MKKLILFIAILCFADDTKEILSMINLLQTQKSTYQPITKLYNPFITKNNKKSTLNKINFNYNITKKTPIYHLEVIFQNKARINNQWYKNNDKLGKYIVLIKNGEVYLKSKHKLIHLKRKTLLKVTQ